MDKLYILFSSLLLAADLNAVELCQPPYIKFGHLCLYPGAEKLPFNEAREYCRSLGGGSIYADLLTVNNCQDFVLLSKFLTIEEQPGEKVWIGAVKDNEAWLWLNLKPLGTGSPFFAYDEGETDGENCALMDGEKYWKLADRSCDEHRKFLCGINDWNFKEETSVIREDIKCPLDSIQIGDYCYFMSNYATTWSIAEERCRVSWNKFEGALYYPKDCEEYSFIAHHIESGEWRSDYWVGAKDVTGDNSWSWVDGQPVTGGMPFWAYGSPRHFTERLKHCAYMDKNKRYYMTDGACETTLRHYVCKLHYLADENNDKL